MRHAINRTTNENVTIPDRVVYCVWPYGNDAPEDFRLGRNDIGFIALSPKTIYEYRTNRKGRPYRAADRRR